MKEKLKGFFKSEKVKECFKKVFTKKIIGIAIVGIVLITALRVGFCLMFQVEGNVMKVDGNNIVVANFFYTKTVNTGNLNVDSNAIQVGERIKITKNLSGDVISIQSGGGRHGEGQMGLGRPGKERMGQGKRYGGQMGPGQRQFGQKGEQKGSQGN